MELLVSELLVLYIHTHSYSSCYFNNYVDGGKVCVKEYIVAA